MTNLLAVLKKIGKGFLAFFRWVGRNWVTILVLVVVVFFLLLIFTPA